MSTLAKTNDCTGKTVATSAGMTLGNGVSKKEGEKIAEVLTVIFADTYTLYVKTQNFHWNVTGPTFPILHLLFEKQYGQLAEGVDELAERLRALQQQAPGSFSEFSRLTSLQEAKGVLSAQEMVSQLLADHEQLSASLRKAIVLSNDVGDDATADLLIKRLHEHEKTAWMLRSTAE